MPALGSNRDFMSLWAAQAISAVGARITRTVLPILALLTIGGSPTEVAILAMLGVGPALVVSLLAGGMVDRRPKRALMIGADLVRAALLLTIPVAALLGDLTMIQLYLVAGLVGAATMLFDIADNTFLPAIVDRAQLVDANARLEATDAVAEGVGPWIGGILVSAIGAPLAIAVDALSYIWSALFLRRINRAESHVRRLEEDGQGLLADAASGLKTAKADTIVSRLLAAATVQSLGGGVFMALYMVVVIDTLSLGPGLVGFIIGIGGLGAAAGSLIASPLQTRLGVTRALLVTFGCGILFDFAVPLSVLFPQAAVPLLLLAQFCGDGLLTAFAILALSLRQARMPQARLGRVNATFELFGGGATLIGAGIAAALVLYLPVGTVIWGAALAGPLAFFLLSPLRTESS